MLGWNISTVIKLDLSKIPQNFLTPQTLARLTAENFLHNFPNTNRRIKVSQELARMDFEIVHSIHQNEIDKVSRWWKEQGLPKELKFAKKPTIEMDENQDGRDESYVECYMKEHQSSSVEQVREHVTQMITNTWKRLNQEYIASNPFPMSFKKASLNAAGMVPLIDDYDDNCYRCSTYETCNDVAYHYEARNN
ncbi:hypothetical protein FNV43_RR07717 [Rhamnella rubrinervis]|uniref:Terpene synthase metal-binding domain-containing protein n=1 Tax=Rhamnella rubrinervis TaxID=2594499 RepID=A0A8K0HF85_9ROSA|nr:hypothetical protein FNV43_RR07717 [Rhamnella rubrinervis]